MIFNRANKIVKGNCMIKDVPIESVKTFKYLGFTINAKNCSFLPTVNDLSTRANRAIFVLNNKIKLSKLPIKLALKVFNSQIVPILLYGCEVWGPYMNLDFNQWDKTKCEQVQTQFVKRLLGCNIHTSNAMILRDVGCRPLLVTILERALLYYKTIMI